MAQFRKFAFLAMLGLFSSSAAQAACTLGDLRGTWYAEGVGGGIAGHCKLVFGNTGALVTGAAGSECSYEKHSSDGFLSVKLRASGQLALVDTQTCSFAGDLSVGAKKLSTSRLSVRMSGGRKDILTASGPVTEVSNGYFSMGHTSVLFTALKKSP